MELALPWREVVRWVDGRSGRNPCLLRRVHAYGSTLPDEWTDECPLARTVSFLLSLQILAELLIQQPLLRFWKSYRQRVQRRLLRTPPPSWGIQEFPPAPSRPGALRSPRPLFSNQRGENAEQQSNTSDQPRQIFRSFRGNVLIRTQPSRLAFWRKAPAIGPPGLCPCGRGEFAQ